MRPRPQCRTEPCETDTLGKEKGRRTGPGRELHYRGHNHLSNPNIWGGSAGMEMRPDGSSAGWQAVTKITSMLHSSGVETSSPEGLIALLGVATMEVRGRRPLACPTRQKRDLGALSSLEAVRGGLAATRRILHLSSPLTTA